MGVDMAQLNRDLNPSYLQWNFYSHIVLQQDSVQMEIENTFFQCILG